MNANTTCLILLLTLKFTLFMLKERFYINLINATETVYPFTMEMVSNPLPNRFKYFVKIKSAHNENLNHKEFLFPHEEYLDQKSDPLTARDVVELLWMDEAIPVWINMQIEDYDEQHTHVSLICSGRYSKHLECSYHLDEGYPPFHVQSPPLPTITYNKRKKRRNYSKKFDLHWNKKSQQLGFYTRILNWFNY